MYGRVWRIIGLGLWLMIGGVAGNGQMPSKPAPAVPPAIRAAAAIVMDAKTGEVLLAKNPDKRLPPASTTKILTALMLAERVLPQQAIVTSPAAASTPGMSLGMKPGEKYPARDLLYAIMLVSANDASEAVAEQMAGTPDKFAAQMNTEAQKLGAPNTTFTNPHGLPDPNHLSTARDLATIARNALQNPAFNAAAQTRTYAIPRTPDHPAKALVNVNDLLWTVPGMDGVKTGFTDSAGRCFVGSATRNGRRLITVVLNSPDWKGETIALLNYGFGRPTKDSDPGDSSVKGKKPSAGTTSRPGNPASAHVAGTKAPQTSAQAPDGPSETPQTAEEPSGSMSPAGSPREAGGIPRGLAHSGVPHVGGHPGAPLSVPGIPAGIGKKPDTMNARPGENGRKDDPAHEATTPQNTTGWGRNGGAWPRFTPREAPAPHLPWDWRWLLWLLLLLACRWLWKLAREGKLTMNLSRFKPLFGKRQRRKEGKRPEAQRARTPAPGVKPSVEVSEPAFAFRPPALARYSGQEWLESLLNNATRLLEPSVRRVARALIEADPGLCSDSLLALLSAPNAKTRVAAAALVAPVSLRRAEETLLAVLNEEGANADLRAEAAQQLAQLGGDRHEPFWREMLVRDGAPYAANALASLPRLEEATRKALQHTLVTPRTPTRDSSAEARANLRAAHIACVLARHGVLSPEEADAFFAPLSVTQQEQTLLGTLRGVESLYAIEKLVELALTGRAYPALQALMEADPAAVRGILGPRLEQPGQAGQARAMILKWALLGEGEADTIRKIAAAGDDLAKGAINLVQMQRWNPASVPPDALLAAALIASLRLGYSTHTQEQIGSAFRAAAAGETTGATEHVELEPIAQAYANPMVRDAVQTALYAEDGVSSLLAGLARHPENRMYQEEMAFWADKTSAETRLLMTHALSGGESEAASNAVAARASDADPKVRAAALRALSTLRSPENSSATTDTSELPQTPKTEPPVSHPESLDRAA